MTLNRQYDGGSAELENNNCMLRSSHTASNNNSRDNEGSTSHPTFVWLKKKKNKTRVATSPLANNRLNSRRKKLGNGAHSGWSWRRRSGTTATVGSHRQTWSDDRTSRNRSERSTAAWCPPPRWARSSRCRRGQARQDGTKNSFLNFLTDLTFEWRPEFISFVNKTVSKKRVTKWSWERGSRLRERNVAQGSERAWVCERGSSHLRECTVAQGSERAWVCDYETRECFVSKISLLLFFC